MITVADTSGIIAASDRNARESAACRAVLQEAGTVIISPKRHGYETALNMYDWVANNKEPEKLTLTSGALAKRDDYQKVRQGLGIE